MFVKIFGRSMKKGTCEFCYVGFFPLVHKKLEGTSKDRNTAIQFETFLLAGVDDFYTGNSTNMAHRVLFTMSERPVHTGRCLKLVKWVELVSRHVSLLKNEKPSV
eukprot:TRINITY_DN16160_c0_g1_i2.p1 TRINITY_DN16160_c0_g1~~TRINITY_DN16160_c0_g1_i2.p1  ORF type:complete len:105 (+),score=3.51 TRINITY_DN16160_c0_g1_i2:104-418(+)